MNQLDYIVQEIESLPPVLRVEVADYIGYIKKKYKINEKEIIVRDITLASQDSLAKEWLSSEEDEAWKDL